MAEIYSNCGTIHIDIEVNMAATDTKILEARLATRDSAISGSSLSRCAYRMQQFYNLVGDTEDSKALSVALQNYSRDLLLYGLEMEKYEQTDAMCDREIEGMCCCDARSCR